MVENMTVIGLKIEQHCDVRGNVTTFQRVVQKILANVATFVEYINVQHLYRILIPPAHVLLSFCVE